MAVLATVYDPDGRRVDLTAEQWDHIQRRHPELGDDYGLLMEIVGHPDHRSVDPIRGRERFWQRNVGPSAWLRVVVDFALEPGEVVTAFPSRKTPIEQAT